MRAGGGVSHGGEKNRKKKTPRDREGEGQQGVVLRQLAQKTTATKVPDNNVQ